ncbi:SDR family NAD(P)-dependent oxidoreductase [Inquilinus limosus]|uniref:SDR family NAD(P)-dependent oxidoreductase n=1 Tax=Inquilinus limosus TaxID=171674 RepID=UPI000425DCAB|nr:SDR family oxidoreductase [Inquilinus limosus]
MADLSGKVALVTGASRGIGAAIARRLAREGADIALTYSASPDRAREVAGDIEAAGRRVLLIQADSADPAAAAAAVDRAAAGLGRLDILVANAGIAVHKPFAEFTVEEFDRTVAVNVRGVFVAAQTATRHLPEGGRIIVIGSNLADRVPRAGTTLYTLSKTALTGLVKGAARDLGPQGITVNLVQPGPTDTDMNPADGPRADALRALMAIPRYGTGDDIAGLVAWVASPESRFVTGAALAIDGGMSI